MDSTTVIAIIGALSWLPHAWQIFKETFKRPKIEVHLGNALSIGYNNRGIELSINLAVIALNKVTSINKIQLSVLHANSKDERNLEWDWIEDTTFTLEHGENSSTTIKKNHSITLLSIKEGYAAEKKVSFYSPVFQKNISDLNAKLLDKFEEHNTYKNFEHYKQLMHLYEEGINFWQEGEYKITLKVYESSLKEALSTKTFYCKMTRRGLAAIKSNLPKVSNYIDSNYSTELYKDHIWSIQKLEIFDSPIK